MFVKIARIFTIVMFLAGLIVLPAAAAGTFSISGTVTLNGVGMKGIPVKVNGTTFKTTTSLTGAYMLTVPAGTSGTVVVVYPNYSFAPATGYAFTSLAANQTGKNFIATLTNHNLYTISGTVTFNGVGLAGVTVSYLTFSAVTAANGSYTILNVPAGNTGRVVAKLSGYGFTPTGITIRNLSANQVNFNFTAAQVYTIGGKVTDQTTLLPVSGVTVTCGTLSATTSATGTYTIRNVLPGTSCTLTPSLAGKTFSPANRVVTSIAASLHSQSFVAIP